MPPIINAQGVSKTYGLKPLFENISFTVLEGDRIGVIGPNGAGKSTLLQILSGRIPPDTGDVALQKRVRLSYVAQHPEFDPGQTVVSILEDAMDRAAVPEADRLALMAEIPGRAGFGKLDIDAATLSGGWSKRLAIISGLVQAPDVLLLDEPTNHLDLEGIKWLESMLQSAKFASVTVSHDRYLLENIASSVVELNRVYEGGLLRVQGNYSAFLQAKDEYLASQGRRQESLANRVRTEIEWLRRGPKARATKAKARIENAQELIGELADLNARSQSQTVGIDFSSTHRRTKRLVELEGIEYNTDRTLFKGIEMSIQPGMRIGLAGPNGSGKTTLLRLIKGDLHPSAGNIKRADQLRIVYFDQNRQLPLDITLKRALAPDSDSVVYQDRAIHVAAWADRFLFSSDSLNQPVGKLSGGERARLLIAQLMLQPADLLLLDEPTNDLDIPTLQVLEESLLDFRGALVLVTHDRYMMDRIATTVLGLDGLGTAAQFADYSQCDEWQRSRQANASQTESRSAPQTAPRAPAQKRKLSYIEAREYTGIEERIAAAEQSLEEKRAALNDPAIASDGTRLIAASAELDEAQRIVDALYARWAELEDKQS